MPRGRRVASEAPRRGLSYTAGMPSIRPFRGLGYALDRFGGTTVPDRVRLPGEAERHPGRLADLSDVTCPPYDVIGPAVQAALLARHPYNAVRLELAPDADPHAAAAATLDRWLGDGVLEVRPSPELYYYSHARSDDPDDLAVQGVVARVLLEPWGAGVRPHEHTMRGPKEDRLALLRAARTQLSPILALTFDRSERYRHAMSRGWSDEWRARDEDGLLHQLVAIEPDERLLNYLSRQRLYVADGHHRYETALAYQAEVRSHPDLARVPPGELAADWIMMVIMNGELEELEIQATHRLLAPDDGRRFERLLHNGDGAWNVQPTEAEALPEALARIREPAPAFGVLTTAGAYLVTADPDAVAERMRREPTSTAVRRLDLAALHAVLLRDGLGIGPDEVAAGRLTYTRSADEAFASVRAGAAGAAILVRPTRLDQLAEVANASDVMPQKSTYFYPKLLTGMVFNPLTE